MWKTKTCTDSNRKQRKNEMLQNVQLKVTRHDPAEAVQYLGGIYGVPCNVGHFQKHVNLNNFV